MDQVKTATGKIFQSDYISVIHMPNRAYIRILNAPISEIAMTFGNPQETVQLWHGNHYLANYTRLVAIVPEADAIKVILTKE